MPVARLTISLPYPTLASVDSLGTQRSTIIALIIDRYIALIEDAQARLRTQFSHDELNAIIDAGQGYSLSELTNIALLPVHVERTCRSEQSNDVHIGRTVAKLQLCTLLELTALAHLIAQGEHLNSMHVEPVK